jgi:hypothetical protein
MVPGVTRLIMLAAWAALLSSPPMPAVGLDAGWRPAVDRLAREKTLAEGCASILKTFGDHAPMARVQGQRLYARAKADVDGLIALLKADLAGQRSPADIPALSQRLEAVPKQRQALCRHVDGAVGMAVRRQRGRTRPADLLAEGSGGAASSMIDAAVHIWNAYRDVDHLGRATIISRIEATRWRPYAEIPAA